MKKIIFLLTIICLVTLSAFAQTPKFSGEWTLDKAKSKLDKQQSALLEKQTLLVEQTEKEIDVTVKTNQIGGENTIDIGGGKKTYPLDGKEVTSETNTQIGIVVSKFKGEIKDGKLKLDSTRTFNTSNGDVSLITKDAWELSADGKTLTIKREAESPQGKISSELVYLKRS